MPSRLSKNDSWIILGPRRTGSKLISNLIAQAYNDKNMSLKEYDARDIIKEIEVGEIWQTHDPRIVKDLWDETQLIVNTRNIIDISLSWFKAKEAKVYHLWESNPKLIRKLEKSVPKFNLDILELKVFIREIIDWHNIVVKYNPDCICIDYSQFEHDPKNIYKMLDMDVPKNYYSPIRKTPGSNEDWIKNWAEVKKFIDNNPQLNCPPQAEFFKRNKAIVT